MWTFSVGQLFFSFKGDIVVHSSLFVLMSKYLIHSFTTAYPVRFERILRPARITVLRLFSP